MSKQNLVERGRLTFFYFSIIDLITFIKSPALLLELKSNKENNFKNVQQEATFKKNFNLLIVERGRRKREKGERENIYLLFHLHMH